MNDGAVPPVTVTFSTTAEAPVAGTPPAPVTSSDRVWPAVNGPARATLDPDRVSSTREGGRAWKPVAGGSAGVTAADGLEAVPWPPTVRAATVNVYGVPRARPGTMAAVPGPSTLTVAPPGLAVTWYPMIVCPPLSAGGAHVTMAALVPAAAATPLGAPGGRTPTWVPRGRGGRRPGRRWWWCRRR